METSEAWPDWGRLIDDARGRVDLSQNEAAKRAEMSGTRWRQIVSGAAGPMASERGIKTVVRMARVVGLTHEAFEGVRDDVADWLLDIERAEAMERSEEINADTEAALARIKRQLGLLTPRQLELIERMTAELARAEEAVQNDQDLQRPIEEEGGGVA